METGRRGGTKEGKEVPGKRKRRWRTETAQSLTFNAKSNHHRNYRIGIMSKREKRAGVWRDWQKRRDDRDERDPSREQAVGRQAPATGPG